MVYNCTQKSTLDEKRNLQASLKMKVRIIIEYNVSHIYFNPSKMLQFLFSYSYLLIYLVSDQSGPSGIIYVSATFFLPFKDTMKIYFCYRHAFL